MAADDLDILTMPEALRALSLSDNNASFTEELEQLITAVTGDIESFCGPVVQREVTESLCGYGPTLWLTNWPVVSITTLTEYTAGSVTPTSLLAEDEDTFLPYGYLLNPANGEVTRRASGFTTPFATGDRNIVAVYIAGRYEDTASVHPRFKNVAKTLLRAEWRTSAPSRQRSQDFDEGEIVGYATTEELIKAKLPRAYQPTGPR